MKPVLRYLAVGIPLYLLFLTAFFPAARAYRFADEVLAKSMPQLELAGLEGSVWSGRAGMVVYRKALLGEANWQLSPFPLLLGKAKLKAMLQSDNGYLQSRVSTPIGGGSVALADIEGQLPLSELLRFTPYLPVVLEGQVSLDLPLLELAADGRLLRAEGTILWHQAAMSAPQALTFGDLQLVLRTENEGQVAGDISDRGGPLKVAGALHYSPDGSYRVSGTATPTAQAPSNLRQALGLLGKPDTQGRYRFNFSGRM